MAKKLYVGNLPHSLNNNDLQQLFEAHGAVLSANVIIDRDTGRSKGFGFVEMSKPEEADAAIEALNGSEVQGRALTVNEARPQVERAPRGPRNFDRGPSNFRGGGREQSGGRRY